MEKNFLGGGASLTPSMMTVLKYSFFILLLAPSFVFATSKEIPTSIQIIDVSGHTVVTTSTPTMPAEKPRAPFPIPPVCVSLFKDAPPKIISSTPKGHPLATRIESQRDALRRLTDEISFAPYLPQKDSVRLGEHLVALGQTASSSHESLECLSLLTTTFHAKEGDDTSTLTRKITETILGLEYGMRNISSQDITVPTTAQEALYAGDLLMQKCTTCISLSLTEDTTTITTLLPVRVLGQWEKLATLRITVDHSNALFNAPWWIMLGSHRLSEIKHDIGAIVVPEKGIAGMFLRAQQITHTIAP